MERVETASERRLRLVDEHGYNGLALLTQYDGWRYFEPPEVHGFVAFELHRGTAVACGDPVCAESDLGTMLERFAAYCAVNGWRFAFVGASARVGRVAADLGYRAVKVGEEPFFDLATYTLSGRGAKKARSAINLARRSGITVEEYRQHSPAVDNEIAEIARDWLDHRQAPPMGFLLRSRPFARRERKRTFLAWHQGRLVGAMTCAPAAARGLLYVEEQLRRSDAPYGTTELLIHAVREQAKAEGLRLLSLGASPLQGATNQPYGRFRALRAFFSVVTTRWNFIYSFRSLNHYKKKFAPSFWEDSFVVYRGALALTVLGIVTAFAPDGIPSLVLPKKLQWLRFVPAAMLWAAAAAGVVGTAFVAWAFPELTAPARLGIHTALLALIPADLMFDRTQAAVAAHRLVATVIVLGVGAVMWQRRARA
jgi:phosphatidylglycerol lysyltransferase